MLPKKETTTPPQSPNSGAPRFQLTRIASLARRFSELWQSLADEPASTTPTPPNSPVNAHDGAILSGDDADDENDNGRYDVTVPGAG